MKTIYSSTKIAFLIWLITNALIALFCCFFSIPHSDLLSTDWLIGFVIIFFGCITSSPVWFTILIAIPIINNQKKSFKAKRDRLYLTCFIALIPYSLIGAFLFASEFHTDALIAEIYAGITTQLFLFGNAMLAMYILHKPITQFFTFSKTNFMQFNQMDDAQHASSNEQSIGTNKSAYSKSMPPFLPEETGKSGKTLMKALITAGLILGLLIPTAFVENLVKEREARQQEVVKEVTSGWSSEQTLTGPYIEIPYRVTVKDKDDKDVIITKDLYLLPENLEVNGNIEPEIRPRSIYKVLLYRSKIKTSGNFKLQLPTDINLESLVLKDAKLCVGISDFKGIEEKMSVTFNCIKYGLAPGLPTKVLENVPNPHYNNEDAATNRTTTEQREAIGLSTAIPLTVEDFQKSLAFALDMKIKGSEQLHFIPLSANSNFSLSSTWPSPKFDGSNLPNTRTVTEKGFEAKWSFNNANLPFGTALKDVSFNKQSPAFGVSLVQPTDQYAKTMRSVKYAILFIGLTFALFFIIELMQHKPMHPVQYVLIGMALVIFFTLLLSISEFLQFDWAYFLSALATIALITAYAKSHFESYKSASVFASLLSCLYAFIFVLIRLEDAALLVGSIGLFIILALIMFGSRKINWYHASI